MLAWCLEVVVRDEKVLLVKTLRSYKGLVPVDAGQRWSELTVHSKSGLPLCAHVYVWPSEAVKRRCLELHTCQLRAKTLGAINAPSEARYLA